MKTEAFADSARSVRVTVLGSAIAAVGAMCEKARDHETGGILVGSYSADGSEVLIDEALGPPSDSSSTENGFVRGSAGLKEKLQGTWPSGKYYVGEWHFHPKGRTGPSTQDRRQMVEIAYDVAYSCENPILLITGRRGHDEKFGVWILFNHRLYPLQCAD